MGTWISPKDGDGEVVPSATIAVLQAEGLVCWMCPHWVAPSMGDIEMCHLVTDP